MRPKKKINEWSQNGKWFCVYLLIACIRLYSVSTQSKQSARDWKWNWKRLSEIKKKKIKSSERNVWVNLQKKYIQSSVNWIFLTGWKAKVLNMVRLGEMEFWKILGEKKTQKEKNINIYTHSHTHKQIGPHRNEFNPMHLNSWT